MNLKISVAQLNLSVGDVIGNAQKIVRVARTAYAEGVALLLTPELSLCGYPAEDLLLRPALMQACLEQLEHIALELMSLQGMTVVVGAPIPAPPNRSGRYNAALVLREGRVVFTYAKRELPNYGVFDERRYFVPGPPEACVFEVGQGADALKVGLLICEDAWFAEPAQAAQVAGAQLLVSINASPFYTGKSSERQRMMQARCQATGLPLIYAHGVGGQDEIIFDGTSMALQADGSLVGRAPSFQESHFVVEVEKTNNAVKLLANKEPARAPEADLWDALVLGVHDYLRKNGFSRAILGLSGGIDSALVLAIAVDALGPDNVRAVMMPSPYTAGISLLDAREMAGRMKVQYDEISIVPALEALTKTLAPHFEGRPADTTEENIQARIRGVLLMALSNKLGAMVLTTGNKSEMATGYCTLYGDMAGGFAVIKDVFKIQVFALALWRNQHDPYGTGTNPIPERIITRPPSAELRPEQTDQDSLPPYEILDAILERCMERNESLDQIVAAGFAPAVVQRVMNLLKMNEYKRRQAPAGAKLTPRAFGKDWRYPVSNQFKG